MAKLEEFVSAAIQQCLRGIQIAQASDVGAFVAPKISGNVMISPEYNVAYHDGEMYTTMNFDVAVTVDSSETAAVDGSAGVGIKVFNIEAKGNVGSESRFENVSRVQFAVHVRLPSPKHQ